MICWGSCIVASALLGSSVVFMLKSEDREKHDRLVSLLTEEQVQIYEFIKRERASLYATGLLIGVLTGLFYLRMINKKGWKVDCGFVAIVMTVAGMYYSMMPKTTYMLNHLEGREQVDAWLDVYNEMKFRCHAGMVVGVMALPMLSKGLQKLN